MPHFKTPPNKSDLMAKLRSRLENIVPLADEPDFFAKDETLMRFLTARDWDLKEAEKQLKSTIEWRRKYKPLDVDCTWCHEKPGYHSMRQVGFDLAGRPVIYSCFAQVAVNKNNVDDLVAHCVFIIENAQRCMLREGVNTWVFICDCTGVNLPMCNPKLGYGCVQVMSNYYPERLESVLCINHSTAFQNVWKAISVFLYPKTREKVKLIKKKKQLETFEKIFPSELVEWLVEEIKRNKNKANLVNQRQFWKPPATLSDTHDPRGCRTYVQLYIENRITAHRPHPNIQDHENGKELRATLEPVEIEEENDDSSDTASNKDFDMPEEYRIPTTCEGLS